METAEFQSPRRPAPPPPPRTSVQFSKTASRAQPAFSSFHVSNEVHDAMLKLRWSAKPSSPKTEEESITRPHTSSTGSDSSNRRARVLTLFNDPVGLPKQLSPTTTPVVPVTETDKYQFYPGLDFQAKRNRSQALGSVPTSSAKATSAASTATKPNSAPPTTAPPATAPPATAPPATAPPATAPPVFGVAATMKVLSPRTTGSEHLNAAAPSITDAKVLLGRVALVSGGGQGIGAGIAVEFARAGADVCINYVGDSAPAQQTAQEIRSLGRKVAIVEGDVSNREFVERMVRQAEQQLGPISILVTSAIWSARESLLDTKLDDLRRTLDVGVIGTFNCMQVIARRMVALAIKGSMIHISSPHSTTPFKNALDYNTAKAAATHLALSSANELMWKGIRVNLIQPGWTITPGELKFYTREALENSGKQMPLRRMEYPVDLGKAAVFLASDDAAYITGATLQVDGGQYIEGGPSWELLTEHK
eukprot:TRINITY_DN4433_c0_g1_i1.p1 TRINITY_DN4433_c0_g1~~TRINITY_DN4433_c0_g1_i1.p1  ORF type:complete len:487 (+),score=97.65 TRINITY_DN4433_c0_g1_i1:28-1461(+)